MTKLEMSLKIAQQAGAGQVVAKQMVQAMLDAIIEILGTEGGLELRVFGVFEARCPGSEGAQAQDRCRGHGAGTAGRAVQGGETDRFADEVRKPATTAVHSR